MAALYQELDNRVAEWRDVHYSVDAYPAVREILEYSLVEDGARRYLREGDRWHHYMPDFVIRRCDGKHLIVEVKKDTLAATIHEDLARQKRGEQPTSAEGRKAIVLKRWKALNPERLSYELVFAASDTVSDDALDATRSFIGAAE